MKVCSNPTTSTIGTIRDMREPELIHRHETRLSPWVTLVARTVDWKDGRTAEVYHAFSQGDYVSILPITDKGTVLLVRQYRPACERLTVELPGGLLEPGEMPSQRAMLELIEETGHDAGRMYDFGFLMPDPGRLSNRLWCFAATGAKPVQRPWRREPGLEPFEVSVSELKRMIVEGRIDNALHVAIVGQALLSGLI